MTTSTISNFDSYAGYLSASVVSGTPPSAAFQREFYRLLRGYYLNNGLYQFINDELQTTRISNKDVKALRNPANRVVEFYASKLWPGKLPEALPIEADSKAIIDPIHQIWAWSNFQATKQRMARMFANLGDMVIKVNTKQNESGEVTSVYLQNIDPTFASDVDIDERGYVTYIRLDIPQTERKPDGTIREYTHTEVWDKDAQIWRVWEHDGGLDEELNRIKVIPESGTFEESHGEDFVPFVYQSFRDDGNGRGNGAFTAQLDKIDEVNKKATRLAQLLFRHNRADKALVSDAMDSAGRPIPPPIIDNLTNSDSKIEIDGEVFWRFPSGWRLEHLVANLNYEAHLKAVESDLAELEKDLPELAWQGLSGMDQTLSGRALKYMLDAAVAKADEARNNAESALSRANQMALTIGQNVGLFDESIGNYDNGDFAHTFAPRDIIPPDELEQAEIIERLVRAKGSLYAAALQSGKTEDQARQLSEPRRLSPLDNTQ